MTWRPFSLERLETLIREGMQSADDEVAAQWSERRIAPEKWECSPWGDDGGGFWVVAIHDGIATWYNDLEDGFNESRFTEWGRLDEYWCNQASFSTLLSGLPAARAADDWTGMEEAEAVPGPLAGGGAIERRQTTYWTLRSEDGGLWRVHFRNKVETRFATDGFLTATLLADHPRCSIMSNPKRTCTSPGQCSTRERCTGPWNSRSNRRPMAGAP